MKQNYDLIIVGGGIAGGALATAMASAGKSVLALEKSTEYQDHVRGELLQPWGVAEATELGILDVFLAAGGHFIAEHAELGDGIDSDAVVAAPLNLALLPGIPGPLALGHPTACNALEAAATEAGAVVLRGVQDVDVQPGSSPGVTFTYDGKAHDVQTRIVVGADGRNSVVGRQLGLEAVSEEQHHWISGLLVEDVHEWPDHLQTMGTHGDAQLFIFPQGAGRLRLYMCYALEEKTRLAGADAERTLLEAFNVPAARGSTVRGDDRGSGQCLPQPQHDGGDANRFRCGARGRCGGTQRPDQRPGTCDRTARCSFRSGRAPRQRRMDRADFRPVRRRAARADEETEPLHAAR